MANSEVWAAIVGAAAVLVGVVLAQHYEARRRKEERVEEQATQLKQAYADWFAALQGAITRLAHLAQMTERGTFPKFDDLFEQMQNDNRFTGQHLLIFEPDAEARRRINTLAQSYVATAMKITAAERSQRRAIGTSFATEAGQVIRWITEVRFAPHYKASRELPVDKRAA